MRGLKYFLYKPGGGDDVMLTVLACGLIGVCLIYGVDFLYKKAKGKKNKKARPN